MSLRNVFLLMIAMHSWAIRCLTSSRLVLLPSIWRTIYWSFHSWWHRYWVPTDWKSWTSKGQLKGLQEELAATAKRWSDLAPFFASHNYYLYERTIGHRTYPSSTGPTRFQGVAEPPFARPKFKNDEDLEFTDIQGCRVWAARDGAGREVVIKLVAAQWEESDELKIYRRINTAEARADPRNRTLPVLDYIHYNGLVFVVTPRWGPIMVGAPPFTKVEQVLSMVEQYFEGLAFLHEHRIAHRDITSGNMVMNVLYYLYRNRDTFEDPTESSTVRYAFIDFEASAILPLETDIEKVEMTRDMRTGARNARLKRGESNPFKDDVAILGNILQRWNRVIEDVVPEIGPFFDNLVKDGCTNPPTAAVALKNLQDIKSRLNHDQLNKPPSGRIWDKGKVEPYPYERYQV
ncbi:other/AgaK1 protein kinase, variant 2 [Coprinopsis cinerea AmutBmut pab1-1]|nr:other/AgaK1 protein kinase [Coprinopsis cinerea AmutBmut pab1-1]KAG2004778.1 other/AgaK1 protein kinase, variant 2 [Coprinopsis cinerea AmutBmut pab1-1]